MIIMTAKCTVALDKGDAYKALVLPLIEKSRLESGCLFFALYEDQRIPGVLMFMEHFVDRAAIDFHKQTEHFTSTVPLLDAMQTAATVVNYYAEVTDVG